MLTRTSYSHHPVQCFVSSFFSIRLKAPTRIKLSASRPRFEPGPVHDPLEPLAELSLSPKASLKKLSAGVTSRTAQLAFSTPMNPQIAAFPGNKATGQQQGVTMDIDEVDRDFESAPGDNSMDWTPSSPPLRSDLGHIDSGTNWTLAPQRFFAPQEPTGLERLFETSLRVADEPRAVASGRSRWWTRLW